MANPFPANFETPEGSARLEGQVNFTDPANQPGGGGTTLATTEVSAAQILTLKTVPVTLVAAPGVGMYLLPLFLTFSYSFGTTAYVVSDPAATLTWPNATGIATALNAASDKVSPNNIISLIDGQSYDIATVENQPLAFSLTAAAADPTLGDGTLSVGMVYSRVDIV